MNLKESTNFYLLIGPLISHNKSTGVSTLIGVTVDAAYTWDKFKTGPVSTYARITAVLPWILSNINQENLSPLGPKDSK